MSTTSRVVVGVHLAKVDRAHLNKVAGEMGIEPDGIARTVEALALAYGTRAEVTCNNCGGQSPKELTACPFCGDKDEEEPALEPEVSKAIVAAPVAPEAATKMLGAGERELDAAVGRINDAKVRTAREYFQLCREISIVHGGQLWKARSREGKPRYKTWGEFVEAEIEVSRSTVYSMMGVAEKYTLEQVEIIGQRKCELILTAPREKQGKLLDAAARGESVRKLEAKVRELNLGRKKKGGPPQKEGSVQERKDEMTLALIVGKTHTLPMYKPGKAEGEGAKLEPAKKFEDQPWACRDLPNGVREVFRVARAPSGQLVLKIKARREE